MISAPHHEDDEDNEAGQDASRPHGVELTEVDMGGLTISFQGIAHDEEPGDGEEDDHRIVTFVEGRHPRSLIPVQEQSVGAQDGEDASPSEGINQQIA